LPWISAQARQIFGAYRRDDFADPEGFLLQLGMVLERYPDAVVRDVSSPITGIQRRSENPPTIAKVVAACDAEVARAARIARANAAGTVHREPRELGQNRANVFVPADNALYQAMVDKTRGADALDYRYDGERAGIWVALGWIDDDAASVARAPRRFTSEDLAEMYKRHDAAGEAA
jgi:hypothetical protein